MSKPKVNYTQKLKEQNEELAKANEDLQKELSLKKQFQENLIKRSRDLKNENFDLRENEKETEKRINKLEKEKENLQIQAEASKRNEEKAQGQSEAIIYLHGQIAALKEIIHESNKKETPSFLDTLGKIDFSGFLKENE